MNSITLTKQHWQMLTKETLDDIIMQVQCLSIIDVLQKYGIDIVRFTGSKAYSLCPFHLDEHIGSFVIDTEKNYCWCFACHKGGSLIKSMQIVWNKSFIDTVLQIACDFNLISKDTYVSLINAPYERKGRKIKKANLVLKKKERPSEKTLNMWTDVYTFMKDWFKLQAEDKIVLQNKRRIPNERLEDYFSCNTTNYDIVKRFIFDLKSHFPQYVNYLSEIPGFVEIKEKGKWNLTLFEYNAIGILLRNENGKVIAVQLRDKNENAQIRYKFLSFKAYPESKTVKGGNSVGTPIDILIPKKWNKKIAIVEGRFKAEILLQQGFVTLSVQGVNNYKGIWKDIKNIENKIGCESKAILVFYDADQLRNSVVYKAGINLGKYIKENLNRDTLFAIWNPLYGKGIDDLILNGHKNDVKLFKFSSYKNAFDTAYEKAKVESNIKDKKVINVKKKERELFYNYFFKFNAKFFNVM